MKLEIVISKSSCKYDGFVMANPAFFNVVECKGCSLHHLCGLAVGNEAKIYGVDEFILDLEGKGTILKGE